MWPGLTHTVRRNQRQALRIEWVLASARIWSNVAETRRCWACVGSGAADQTAEAASLAARTQSVDRASLDPMVMAGPVDGATRGNDGLWVAVWMRAMPCYIGPFDSQKSTLRARGGGEGVARRVEWLWATRCAAERWDGGMAAAGRSRIGFRIQPPGDFSLAGLEQTSAGSSRQKVERLGQQGDGRGVGVPLWRSVQKQGQRRRRWTAQCGGRAMVRSF